MLAGNNSNWNCNGFATQVVVSGSRTYKRGTPETKKDERYWERRKNNNILSRRSREKTRQVENYIRNRYIALEEENALLRKELRNIKLRYRVSPAELFLSDKDRQDCNRKVNEIISQVLGQQYRQHRNSNTTKHMNRRVNPLQRVCQTPPDTTTSSPNVSPHTVNISHGNELNMTVRPRKYEWNVILGPGPTYRYVYIPVDEDTTGTDSSPEDLSPNKGRIPHVDGDCNTRGKVTKISSTITRVLSPENLTVTDRDQTRTSKELVNSADDDVTVLDLTRDEESDSNDDLNLKLQKPSEQISAKQRLVYNP